MLIDNLDNWYDDIMNDNEVIPDNYLENFEQRLNNMSSAQGDQKVIFIEWSNRLHMSRFYIPIIQSAKYSL